MVQLGRKRISWHFKQDRSHRLDWLSVYKQTLEPNEVTSRVSNWPTSMCEPRSDRKRECFSRGDPRRRQVRRVRAVARFWKRPCALHARFQTVPASEETQTQHTIERPRRARGERVYELQVARALHCRSPANRAPAWLLQKITSLHRPRHLPRGTSARASRGACRFLGDGHDALRLGRVRSTAFENDERERLVFRASRGHRAISRGCRAAAERCNLQAVGKTVRERQGPRVAGRNEHFERRPRFGHHRIRIVPRLDCQFLQATPKFSQTSGLYHFGDMQWWKHFIKISQYTNLEESINGND